MELISAILENLLFDASLLFLAFIFWKTNRVSFSALFPKMPLLTSLGRGFAVAFFLLAASMAIGAVATMIGINDTHHVSETLQALQAVSPWLMVYLLVVRVTVEEIFFRVFLTREIGVVASTVLFAIGHAGYGSLLEVIGAFILGLILAYYYQQRKDVNANIIAHMVYNAVVFALLMSAPSF